MIHQYKLNGYNIVLDVYSGSVHAVDELAYDAIALIDAGHPRAEAADLLAKKYADHPEVTAEDINDCFDDIEELRPMASCLPRIFTLTMPLTSKIVPPLSRRSACMWPTPAT